MRVVPGLTVQDQWMSQDVDTGFIQPASTYTGIIPTIEEVTKDISQTISTETPTVPVTSLDKAERVNEITENTVVAEVPKVPETTSSSDDSSPGICGTPYENKLSYANVRMAPPSIIPTKTFREMQFSDSDRNKMSEGFRSRQPRETLGIGEQLRWGLTGAGNPQNVVESFCSKNWCSVQKVIVALICITIFFLILSIVFGIKVRLQRKDGTFIFGKGTTTRPQTFGGRLSPPSQQYSGGAKFSQGTGITANDIKKAAKESEYSIF